MIKPYIFYVLIINRKYQKLIICSENDTTRRIFQRFYYFVNIYTSIFLIMRCVYKSIINLVKLM